ncbi:MAG: UDP-N-acetylmuramoyl-tripeptide--D-alanyl-D-alanine ligase [Opitutaceae bacterium]|jgi:UDP-N-acetylmuramoyl-tripeptide--D-alanyl-D-alanine ligase|nr:UDP-N-acetylmuramoyl-tripeptide--D-alanyl-D-alanine ligase [Opitutaceae bacterium]
MPLFTAKTLAAWTAGKWERQPPASVRLTGFSTDTRALDPGQVFVALKTEKRDGHDFLAAAAEAGAAAALVARADPAAPLPQLVVADPLAALQTVAREHRRAFKGPVVAVTGSAGKTSAKDLLALLLGGPADVLSTRGNLNNHIGVPLTLTRLDRRRHKFAVVEAGVSGPGEMGVLAAMIAPDVAVTTLIAPAHLERLGGVEGVAREKAVLSAALPPERGLAIFTADTARHGAFAGLRVPTLVAERDDAFRLGEPPPGRLLFNVAARGGQTHLSVTWRDPAPLAFSMPRVSGGQAVNAVLAIAAALALGIRPRDIQARIVSWRPGELRGELRRDEERELYLDCYNANPASMADALEAFVEGADDKLPRLYIIGGMEELGAESERHHLELGRSLRLRPGDFLMLVGADAGAVRRGALEAGADPAQVHIAESLGPVAEFFAGFKGAVFIKGSRRHALERILAA